MLRRHHRRSFRRRRRGYALVIFALIFFCLMALGALVIDIGLARMTQRQMQTAVDSAALEGLRGRDRTDVSDANQTRREEASKFVDYAFEQDEARDGLNAADARWQGLEQARANPDIDGAFIDLVQDFAYGRAALTDLPQLQRNESNAANGDMAAGQFSQPLDGEPHQEASDYSRNDFEYNDGASAFLVRMRRTGEESQNDISNIGRRLPYLFARGSLMARQLVGTQTERGPGIAVCATAIAQEQRAKSVGTIFSNPLTPGALPLVLRRDAWRNTFPMGSPQNVVVTSDGQLTVGSSNIGFVMDAAIPENNWRNWGGKATPPTTVDPTSVIPADLLGVTVGIYVPILAVASVTPGANIDNHIIGYGYGTIAVAADGTFSLTRQPGQLADRNASAVLTKPLGPEFYDETNDPDVTELLRQQSQELDPALDSLLLAPALVR